MCLLASISKCLMRGRSRVLQEELNELKDKYKELDEHNSMLITEGSAWASEAELCRRQIRGIEKVLKRECTGCGASKEQCSKCPFQEIKDVLKEGDEDEECRF